MNPFDEYTQTLKSAHMEEEFFKFQTAFNAYIDDDIYDVYGR